MSRRSSTWPTPSSTSGVAGSPASGAASVSTAWQKLWKFETARRVRIAGPSACSSRSPSSFAAFTLYVSTSTCSGSRSAWRASSRRTRSTITRVLPVPAAATTTSGPSSQSTIAACSADSASGTRLSVVTGASCASRVTAQVARGTRGPSAPSAARAPSAPSCTWCSYQPRVSRHGANPTQIVHQGLVSTTTLRHQAVETPVWPRCGSGLAGFGPESSSGRAPGARTTTTQGRERGLVVDACAGRTAGQGEAGRRPGGHAPARPTVPPTPIAALTYAIREIMMRE